MHNSRLVKSICRGKEPSGWLYQMPLGYILVLDDPDDFPKTTFLGNKVLPPDFLNKPK
jgi:hypothetical protein